MEARKGRDPRSGARCAAREPARSAARRETSLGLLVGQQVAMAAPAAYLKKLASRIETFRLLDAAPRRYATDDTDKARCL
jgi:hypothetical protein